MKIEEIVYSAQIWGTKSASAWLGQYIKAEVWDFPVMTEQTRLISSI